LLSIPLFILKGAAIGKSRAGADLYSALHAWMHRIPGGLGIANVFACALFAAMAGSSPATCSAIGSAGIPEMRKRGYSGGFAAGIIAAGGTLGILLPPSITMILYAVAAEQSLGRLFLAGIGPGLLLVVLFALYAMPGAIRANTARRRRLTRPAAGARRCSTIRPTRWPKSWRSRRASCLSSPCSPAS
jgi:C4-dicarboxylate transporter DctM subunit